MFLNNLFSIQAITQDNGLITAEISLNAEHEIYNGHFPGVPVTPGVVQLEIVKEILQVSLKRKLRMKAMRTCKFLQIINPQETTSLTISIKFTEGEQLEVVASGQNTEHTFFKAQLAYI
ncbi:3-hydroxyacyl-ACP dehydratase [Dyadobacter luteus]|uniref:3-hydroxyacyl-ACP dehydratase n=1 Tax=Dyadobacter luteus TaxID=2259619 RepID=A0A3D8Y891_9BACT|nr:3-hydroxyacyl-ACP dehydratase [Dyadobacter luteus]REA59429.1 3-hydroxyacyl-ACP dehydratase [Dyadobacter luteus]